jgi:hypothetical protein
MVHRRPEQPEDRANLHSRELHCGLCRRPIFAGRAHYIVIRDSSVIDTDDPSMDGRRVLAACSTEHVDALRAAAPPWCDEQLWCGQLARAQAQARPGAPVPLAALARRAGLNLEQAQRALAWRRADHRGDRHSRA